MKYLLIVLLCSTAAFAENVAFIGKDNNGAVLQKHVCTTEDRARFTQLQRQYPDLTWSVAREGQPEYDVPMSAALSTKERYKTATTMTEKLAVIEEVLNLK